MRANQYRRQGILVAGSSVSWRQGLRRTLQRQCCVGLKCFNKQAGQISICAINYNTHLTSDIKKN
jgi:hypothetical protein